MTNFDTANGLGRKCQKPDDAIKTSFKKFNKNELTLN